MKNTAYTIRHYPAGTEWSGKPYAEAFDVIMSSAGQLWSIGEFSTREAAEEKIAKLKKLTK